ncbi:MAG: hypothetical protein C0412_10330 [Flavobacterium sp.]|nr:hypothetical protein [Flavobacterium sp.]
MKNWFKILKGKRSMQKHQELHIELSNSVEETIEIIEKKLPKNWTRNVNGETELKKMSGSPQFCFEATGILEQDLSLWLINRGNEMVVTNIVPQIKSLSISQYNLVLNSFVNIIRSANLKHSLSKDDLSLEDLIGKTPAKNLRSFSGAANKSTGRSHPCDEERWFAFLYSMIESEKVISLDDLVFFLKDDGWQESTAYELGLDLEYGINAMQYALRKKNEL